jgi:RNA polymerase sigma-70 factor (ECF subfamily)
LYCYLLYFVTFGKEIYTTIKTNYSEEELIVFKRKNETGFHHLYDNYSGALYGVIFRIVQSKEYTEEIIQDVFVKIWNSVHQYDSKRQILYMDDQYCQKYSNRLFKIKRFSE